MEEERNRDKSGMSYSQLVTIVQRALSCYESYQMFMLGSFVYCSLTLRGHGPLLFSFNPPVLPVVPY